jgi:hypothetical protein
LPPFADGLYEQYPLLANLPVREAFVEEYLSFVAVRAAGSNASPLQLLMELVWSGWGPLWGLSGEEMSQLAVPLPFLQEVQRRASVRSPRALAVASPRAPSPVFVPAEMTRRLDGLPVREDYDAYLGGAADAVDDHDE